MPGQFLVDKTGRTYWSASGKPETSAKKGQEAPKAKEEAKDDKVVDVSQFNHKLCSVETVEQYLKENGIDFKTLRHEVTMTNQAMIDTVKFEGAYKNTVLAKQLFLYDKKKKENMWLISADVATEVDMKGLQKYLKVGSGNLRGADLESLGKYLGCIKGNVNYFSMINDVEKKVKVILDKKLFDAERVSFHPMDNTGSISISHEGILKLKELAGRDDSNFDVLDFDSISTGEAAKPAGGDAPKKNKPEQGKKLTAEQKKQKKEEEKAQKVGGNEQSIQYQKEVNFSKWYSDIITKSDMIDYYDISGCYILKPKSYFIWEKIQAYLDQRFKDHEVQNVYFPMFVSQSALEKEKDHLEGFSPEVAWVTKSGQSELDQPIAIRPTSETIMYPAYSKWIRSHRDLPLKCNQWSNVVRWEFKHPTPFIRTREFLWQEGHTAHASEECSTNTVMKILDAYADCYKEILAVPVVKGKKSDDERFAGAYFTTTTEIYVPISGRGIQGATSHNLGQNFAKMFEVQFENKEGKQQLCWQTSWGFSTRSIGAMIMVHSDDKGLVLPPKVANVQVVVIPIMKSNVDSSKVLALAHETGAALTKAGFRVTVDDRENYNPGWKYNNWELKGVPLRLEIGQQEVEKREVRACKRNDGAKSQMKVDNIVEQVDDILKQIHSEMYAKALKAREDHVVNCDNWTDFMSALGKRNIVMAPWCDTVDCESEAKDRSKEESLKLMEEMNEGEAVLTGAAKTLCIPFDQPKLKDGAKCFACGQPAKVTALWGRSY